MKKIKCVLIMIIGVLMILEVCIASEGNTGFVNWKSGIVTATKTITSGHQKIGMRASYLEDGKVKVAFTLQVKKNGSYSNIFRDSIYTYSFDGQENTELANYPYSVNETKFRGVFAHDSSKRRVTGNAYVTSN